LAVFFFSSSFSMLLRSPDAWSEIFLTIFSGHITIEVDSNHKSGEFLIQKKTYISCLRFDSYIR
jgi:hypothetical protein